MAVKVITSSSGSSSSSTTFTYRGSWATSTAYARGDVVIDPNTVGSGLNPTLRFTPKAHTSGASFTTGNENSDTQWMPFPTSGPFKGTWQANTWLTGGDLIAEPGGTLVVSRKSQSTGATYDSTMFGTPILPVIAGLRPDILFPPAGIPDLGELDVAGLWPKRSQVRVPNGTWLKLTANGAEASTSGAGSLAAESDPPGPSGAVKINFPQSPVYALGSTVDLTTNILRLLTKMTGSTPPPSNGSPGTWPNSIITDFYLDVSSTGTFTNYHRARLVKSGDTTNQIPTGAWFWQGAGPAEWVAVGGGATLSAVTHVRLSCTTPGGGGGTVTGVTMSVFGIQSVLNGKKLDGSVDATRKAKVVLIFDDDQVAAWDTAALAMDPYNFPGCIAATIAQTAPSASSSLSGAQLRHLTNRGWQVITHAYSQNEHNTVTDTTAFTIGGIGLRAQHMKSRHLQNIHGVYGGDDFAMFGNNAELNADSMRAIRQIFRTGNRFIGLPRLCETLPPMDPHLLWNWGSGGSDAADATDKLAYVDKAISQKGLAVFRFHAIPTEFNALLAGLETRRAAGDIDVVTLSDALDPWLVAP